MLFTRISLRADKDAAYRQVLTAGVSAALRETFAVPEGDLFAVVHEYAADSFAYDPDYLDVTRGGDLVLIQITANSGAAPASPQATCS